MPIMLHVLSTRLTNREFQADSRGERCADPDASKCGGRIDDLLTYPRHFAVDFDVVVTAQQVRSYKPGRAHFLTARELIGPSRWLHAAESNFHDIVPTNALGIDNAWINRHGQPELPGGTPKYKFDDLAGLANAIV